MTKDELRKLHADGYPFESYDGITEANRKKTPREVEIDATRER
jgi:hypothetical protein